MRLYDSDRKRLLGNGVNDDEYVAQELHRLWAIFSAILRFAAVKVRVWGQDCWNYGWEIAEEFWKISHEETIPTAKD